MNLKINGKEQFFPEPVLASELLNRLGIQPARVVVQRNLKVIRRDDLPITSLEDGDVIEIIHVVGGG